MWDRILANRPAPEAVTEALIPEMQGMPALSLVEAKPDPRPVMYLEDMRVMYACIRTFEMEHAIETGSYTGMSAQAMAAAGAQVWSIDDYSYEFTASRGGGCGIKDRQVHGSIMWILGKGLDMLPTVVKQLPCKPRHWLFLHDSDHSYTNALAELRKAEQLGAGVILCHDVRDWPEDGTDKAFQDFLLGAGWYGRIHCNLGVAWPPYSYQAMETAEE